MNELTGLEELGTIESELKANFFAETTTACATGTCS